MAPVPTNATVLKTGVFMSKDVDVEREKKRLVLAKLKCEAKRGGF
jgi:hypothetical protein